MPLWGFPLGAQLPDLGELAGGVGDLPPSAGAILGQVPHLAAELLRVTNPVRARQQPRPDSRQLSGRPGHRSFAGQALTVRGLVDSDADEGAVEGRVRPQSTALMVRAPSPNLGSSPM